MRGLDVDVAPGQIFGFLGPNGAGKSSTMRMIACVSPRSGGFLQVLGMDPDIDGPRIRARIGVVPQLDNLDTELTVRENLEIYGRYFGLSRAHVRRKAVELMGFAQLGDRARRRRRVAVGRHEAPVDDRPVPGQRPRAAAARRADHGSGPAGPPPAVGSALPAQGRGRHPDRHHALHGRGRAVVRPAGGDGRRGDRRRGLARRADRALLHARGAGAAVRTRHRGADRDRGAAGRPGRGPAGPAPALHRATASTCRPSWPTGA